MAVLQWSEELSVGVVEMDRQHKKLVDLVNRLYEAMAAGQGDDVKKDILNELAMYTRVHFVAEEHLMRDRGYPTLTAHKALHDELTAKVKELNTKVQNGLLVPSVSLGNFLKDWLLKHIAQEDKKYGQFITATVR